MKPYYDEDGITIYHGDCGEIAREISRPDLIVTDPPYGVNYVSNMGQHGPIVGDDDPHRIEELLSLCLARLPLHRHFYVFGPLDVASLTIGATAELIWDKGKPGAGDLSIPWGNSHERITFGVWVPPSFPSQKGHGATPARMRRGTVLSFPKTSNGRGAVAHPTNKPVALLRELVESSSRLGEVVFDPFMGSGSTLVAARLEGRSAVGIEIEERYCEMAAKRVALGQ